MTVQILALLAFALLVLLAREARLYHEHQQLHDRLDEDAEVARLEEWFDLEWID